MDAFAASDRPVGREPELAEIDAFLEGAGGAALALEGEPGIGKTTLWQTGVEAARAQGRLVLEARPAEAERELSFSALGDLVEPALDRLDALSPPRRSALEIALLLKTGAAEARAVGLATLDLLRLLAAGQQLLVAVDDTQWLDPPSREALAYALRRLDNEPIALLTACRPHTEPLGEAQRLVVGPLSLGALHELLRKRVGTMTRPTLVRVHETSGGNPFYALELAHALAARELRPGDPLPVPATLHDLTTARSERLDPDVRDVLLYVAALARPTVEVVLTAAGEQAGPALERATAAGMIEGEGSRVRFTHPLLGAARYDSATRDERAGVHRRLAEVVTDAEERARHLALGTDTPDPDIAAVLDEAARLARARGAPATAAELAGEAVRLTPPDRPGEALRRTVDSAGHHFEAGDSRRARHLLEAAVRRAARGPERAGALWRLARVHVFEADHRTALDLYRQALSEAPGEVEVTLQAESGIAVAMMRMLEDVPVALRHAQTAVKLAQAKGFPQLLPEYVARQALIECLLGRPQAVATARRAAALEECLTAVGPSGHGSFSRGLGDARFMLGVTLHWADDLGSARHQFDAALETCAEIGDEASVPLLLRYRATTGWLTGDWEQALRDAVEGYEASIQTGQPSQQAVLAGTRSLLLAHLGQVDEARGTAEEALHMSTQTGAMFGTILATSALGFLELSLGNSSDADRYLGPLVERVDSAGIREPGATRFVPDEIEALIALGRVEDAEALLSRLDERARRLHRASAVASAERCRALLSAARGDLNGALASLERALVEHDRVSIPFDRARTLLALGSTRRRARLKRSAREALEQALALFEALGATIWAAQARSQLARIGGRAAAAGDALSETERLIADLVAQGRSNKEVATALSLSPKTVEWNLSKVYAKLGVRSRSELAGRRR